MADLSLRGLAKSYGDVNVLKDIDLDIQAGYRTSENSREAPTDMIQTEIVDNVWDKEGFLGDIEKTQDSFQFKSEFAGGAAVLLGRAFVGGSGPEQSLPVRTTRLLLRRSGLDRQEARLQSHGIAARHLGPHPKGTGEGIATRRNKERFLL